MQQETRVNYLKKLEVMLSLTFNSLKGSFIMCRVLKKTALK